MMAAVTPEKKLTLAALQHVELYGTQQAAINCLWIAAAVLTGVLFLSNGAWYLHFKSMADRGPLVVRINADGAAQAIPTDARYTPKEAEVRYFLARFAENHYGREHSNISSAYSESLYFLHKNIVKQRVADDKKERDAFIKDSSAEETKINVRNVAVLELQTTPYRATIDIEKIIYSADHLTSRTENWTVPVQFVVMPAIPAEMDNHNPLGLAITDLRAYQGFFGQGK